MTGDSAKELKCDVLILHGHPIAELFHEISNDDHIMLSISNTGRVLYSIGTLTPFQLPHLTIQTSLMSIDAFQLCATDTRLFKSAEKPPTLSTPELSRACQCS